MIIELMWFEPPDGRQYESPAGGDISAIERYRIDCVECWYTKYRLTPEERRDGDIRDELQRLFLYPAVEWLPESCSDDLQWYEAIYVQYRCAGEVEPKALLGVGYVLTLYGAQQRPDRLEATLGPPKEQHNNAVE